MTQIDESRGTESSAAPAPRRIGNIVFGALLIVLGGAWLLDRVELLTLDGRVILPLALSVVGVALIVGAFDGPHPGLVVISIFLALATIAAAAGPFYAFRDGIGDRAHRISSQSELAEAYRLGLGNLRLDLSELELRESTTLEATVGAGQLTVIVPESLAVEVRASVNAGQVTIFDRRWDGIGVDQTYQTPGFDEARTRLVLDLEVVTGEIEVRS